MFHKNDFHNFITPNLKRKHLKIVLGIPFKNSKDYLEEGIYNLSPLKSGQIIGYRQSGERILAPVDGYAMFPKYPPRDEHHQCISKLPNYILELAVDVQRNDI